MSSCEPRAISSKHVEGRGSTAAASMAAAPAAIVKRKSSAPAAFGSSEQRHLKPAPVDNMRGAITASPLLARASSSSALPKELRNVQAKVNTRRAPPTAAAAAPVVEISAEELMESAAEVANEALNLASILQFRKY